MPRCNGMERAGFTGDTEPTGVCWGCADFCVVWVDERACQKPRRGQRVMGLDHHAETEKRAALANRRCCMCRTEREAASGAYRSGDGREALSRLRGRSFRTFSSFMISMGKLGSGPLSRRRSVSQAHDQSAFCRLKATLYERGHIALL